MDDHGYTSFLVRLWPATADHAGAWSGEIEHIQSGECRSFATLEAALAWLRAALEAPQPPAAPDQPAPPRNH